MKISAKTTHYRREMLRLILKENSLQLGGKPYLQTHGTARRAQRQQVPLPTFSWHILRHKLILSKTAFKPTIWKHYIGDIFLPLGKSKSHIVAEFLRTSKLRTSPYSTIELTAEISICDTETVFQTLLYMQRHKIQ